jgi:hypothetical protein
MESMAFGHAERRPPLPPRECSAIRINNLGNSAEGDLPCREGSNRPFIGRSVIVGTAPPTGPEPR